MPPTENHFAWVEFYQAVADKLLGYRSKRKILLRGIEEIAARTGLSPLRNYMLKSGPIPPQDICPFTAMCAFNRRHMSQAGRRGMAVELGDFLGVEVQVPNSLEAGVSFLDPFNTEGGYIDLLWDVFAAALRFSDSGQHREEFIKAYTAYIPEIRRKLTTGLYLARPKTFLSLDASTIPYIRNNLGLGISNTNIGDGEYYLQLIDRANGRFKEDSCLVHSFPELTAAARGMLFQAGGTPEAPATLDGSKDLGVHDNTDVPTQTVFDSVSTTLHADFVEQTRHLPKATEAERMVVQRIGQNLFRDALLDLWEARCPLSGITHPQLLRASHMMPWAVCATDQERLDVHNGLLLAASLDSAFDAGLISFKRDGTLIVSPELSRDDVARLGLPDLPRLQGLRPEHEPFLAYHRRKVFRGPAGG